jgi:hypothetical protein
MPDLVLQDFEDLSGKHLTQALAHEKTKMFGEKKHRVKKRGDVHSSSKSRAGSFAKVRKARTPQESVR